MKKRSTQNAARTKLFAGMALMMLCYVGAAPFVYKQLFQSKAKASETGQETILAEDIAETTEAATEPVTELQPFTLETTEPTEPVPMEFVTSDVSYFDDALFIGDSRTVGIALYGGIPGADFFCTSGLSSQSVLNGTRIKGKSVDDYLNSKDYRKIYIMLGINETGNMEAYKENIQKLFDKVRAAEPDALILMIANLHVSAKVSQARPSIGNERLNLANQYIEAMTDGQTSFYIDVNPLFDDENHCLTCPPNGDGIHPGGMDYARWGQWLCTQTITAESSKQPLVFRDALKAVFDGKYAMRQGWKADAQFICLISPTIHISESESEFNCLVCRKPDGKLIPWEAKAEDLLAEDWMILDVPPDPVQDAEESETKTAS